MGHYSQLYLDKYYFAWKYDIPSFLSFFFKEEMFYKDVGEVIDEDNNNDVIETNEIGYKCTAEQSIDLLNNLGYDFNQIIEVYTFFYNELMPDVARNIYEAIASDNKEIKDKELEIKFKEYINSFPKLTQEEEIRDFCKFLPELIESTRREDNFEYVIIDFEEIQFHIMDKELEYSPWILLISKMFDWDLLLEYPEILSMFYFRLLLESMSPEAIIKLDLNDIVEEEQEVREIHTELATRLINKISLYNKFFKPLITKEDFIKEKYIKTRGLELLNSCLIEENSFKKGQLLENLIELIFTSNKSLDISSSRVKTGDEEIDLVILNKMKTSFWTAFGSMFFVECKNWNKPIGALEMRDFETKLRNHRNVTSLGLFVSINGFTREAINSLKRIGRENYHIVPIEKKEIEEYLNGRASLFEWLENKVQVIY